MDPVYITNSNKQTSTPTHFSTVEEWPLRNTRFHSHLESSIQEFQTGPNHPILAHLINSGTKHAAGLFTSGVVENVEVRHWLCCWNTTRTTGTSHMTPAQVLPTGVKRRVGLRWNKLASRSCTISSQFVKCRGKRGLRSLKFDNNWPKLNLMIFEHWVIMFILFLLCQVLIMQSKTFQGKI